MRKNILLIKLAFILLFLAWTSNNASAAHYVIGVVNNAYDGSYADNHTVVLWNPVNGINDNLTDIIGFSGSSGANNTYMIDCQLLNTKCKKNDEIRIMVINTGDGYITNYTSITVNTGAYNVANNLRLNSPPNTMPATPFNHDNLSSTTSEVAFNCSANDLDGNLDNITLYGNWSGGWHANETLSAFGSQYNVSFTKQLIEGSYEWGCLATDTLSISNLSSVNYTVHFDLTPPLATSLYSNISSSCGTQDYARITCNSSDSFTGVEKVTIQSIKPSGSENLSAQLLTGDSYYADILLDEIGSWDFICWVEDYSGNIKNLTIQDPVTVNSNLPDLEVLSGNIVFSHLSPIENQEVIINANISNLGCGDANNFLVSFYSGDPSSGGSQIGVNRSLSIPGLSFGVTNISWNAVIGNTNVFVYSDVDNSISEYNESNNKANKTINVTAWQVFYGNTSVNKVLSSSGVVKNLSAWYNESNLTGSVFVVDSESSISWLNLQAIGRNSSGSQTNDDFSDVDNLLSMTSFSDSVSNLFTIDGNNPRRTDSFMIYQSVISNVPVINSTNTDSFLTGILWDCSDDELGSNNGEFDQSDKEDLIFITRVNKNKPGFYGLYDYEIKIPARLRAYNNTESSEVYIYYELN